MSPKLLISVRDEEEAALAAAYPIDVLDVKNPDDGSLGAVAEMTLQKIVSRVPASMVKSVALGELRDFEPKVATELLSHFQLVKIGLAGMASVPDWQSVWRQFAASLPDNCRPVCVAYFDADACHAPPLIEIFELAKSNPGSPVLIDTFDKSGGGLVQRIGCDQLRMLVRGARDRDVTELALAGSVVADQLPVLLECGPDYIGVRGAVCASGRQRLDADHLREFWEAWEAKC
jgi:uncharacterized protein (UPF0264 family)